MQEVTPSVNRKEIGGEMAYGQVSVLAPTLNRYPYLISELEQLKRQTLKPLEILITDQTKAAERRSEFVSAHPELTIRYFPQESTGQCLAWNKLLEEAKGEYVLFLGDDADAIYPDFIRDLMNTLHQYEADMVAAHVEEVGIPQQNKSEGFVKITDGFPICLVRRSLIERAGHMDMVFNKDIRADHDLAMRCHQLGALMLHDYSTRILHHRAPSGGLRTHKARAKTRHQSKNTISTVVIPTTSELYLTKKYFSPGQVKEEIRIRKLSLLFVNGNAVKKLMRIAFVVIKYPSILWEIGKRIRLADQFIKEMKQQYATKNEKQYEEIHKIA
jgi:glycosyltransferase involved in cell wall biosynthesis